MARTRPCLSETRSPCSIAEMQTAGQPHPEVYPAVFFGSPYAQFTEPVQGDSNTPDDENS